MSAQAQLDQLLTLPEVAGLLHVSKDSVIRATRSGKLASVKIGRSRRYKPGDVHRFIELRTIRATKQ